MVMYVTLCYCAGREVSDEVGAVLKSHEIWLVAKWHVQNADGESSG